LTKRVFFYQLILAFFQEHYRPENYNPLNLKEKNKKLSVLSKNGMLFGLLYADDWS